jgi:hypothetical protein
MPSACNRFANSNIPVLSNTLINARCTAICFPPDTKGQQCKRRAAAKAKNGGNFIAPVLVWCGSAFRVK